MTLKQFKAWCNDRACDGCWGFSEAKLCVELLDNMAQIPWWRRNRTWKKIANRVKFAIVDPTNKKIQEVMGIQLDGERKDNGK